eukprot:scaffold4166_cov95-Cylindrotheca_fusiformis.AAC.5
MSQVIGAQQEHCRWCPVLLMFCANEIQISKVRFLLLSGHHINSSVAGTLVLRVLGTGKLCGGIRKV